MTQPKKKSVKKLEKKHLDIESGIPYFEINCFKIGVTPSGRLVYSDEYDSPPSEDCYTGCEDFERFMLTMFKLASMVGVEVPANPYK